MIPLHFPQLSPAYCPQHQNTSILKAKRHHDNVTCHFHCFVISHFQQKPNRESKKIQTIQITVAKEQPLIKERIYFLDIYNFWL